MRASVGSEILKLNQLAVADADGDGKFTANDALVILRYSVGIGNYDDLRRNVLGDDIISIIDTVKNDL